MEADIYRDMLTSIKEILELRRYALAALQAYQVWGVWGQKETGRQQGGLPALFLWRLGMPSLRHGFASTLWWFGDLLKRSRPPRS